MRLSLSSFALPSPAPHQRLLRHAIGAAALSLLVALYLGTTHGLPPAARTALGVFGLALIAWTVLRWDETPVALAAGLALGALGVATPASFYAGLGDDLIWLLAGAFVLAAAWQHSGLAERWALRALGNAATPMALMRRLTWVVIATAFVVPSTSGRAALLLPLFLVLARSIDNERITRALALLLPTTILLSACASLLGAGAHLVAVDFMSRVGADAAPSFLGWAWLAAPFAIASSAAACDLIARVFLSAEERVRPIALPAPERTPITPQQRSVVAVTGLTLAAWALTGWHGMDAAVVALAGALAVTCKPLTGLDLKTAVKKVEWNLILFLAATMVLGEALLDSGAAQVMAQALLQALPLKALGAHGIVAVAVLIALLSHLLITSRTARATVLIPTVALPLAAGGVDASLLIFVVVIGSGFCQTFSVSAKPVALFAKAAVPTYSDKDLLRLSLALLPLMALLLSVFALVVWPAQGLG
jgi:solute carrier family 13 (sodium-dependent dicarboxylate transporter), member 2/3/5